MRIAYLEDDPDQSVLVTRWLRTAGHECEHFATGAALLDAVDKSLPDLFLLDWLLPDTSGEAVMTALRTRFSERAPIVFLTAHDESADLLRVLAAGADDHILKPVDRGELLAFDRRARTVAIGERPITLDDAEYEVALSLFERAGRTVTLALLAKRAARASGGEPSTRKAQGCVARVRAKLRLIPANGWQLHTVTDVGYRLDSVK
jgi:DNA-binding response OmpR family regulator